MWKKVLGYFKDEKNPIKVETRKAFAIIFAILSLVGMFTVASTFKGFTTFSLIRNVQIPQYQSAENLKQKATEIIGIYYLLSGENDINIQMNEMYRYDELEKSFLDALKLIRSTADQLVVVESRSAVVKLVDDTKTTFDRMNQNARAMTIMNMEGKRDDAKKEFAKIGPDIEVFKKGVEQVEKLLNEDLKVATERAQGFLKWSTVVGVLVTIASVLIALVLINNLLKFLSVTLLPISNLMHNLRQAVFSIDKSQKVVSPVSKYSQKVFAKDIVENNIFDLAFNDLGQKTEAFSAARTAMTSVFGEDEMQWSLMEDNFPPLITKRFPNGTEKILKMSYTPLFDEKTENVQNIMIVAEDVTELEKAKREASSKQAEVLVIQGLVGVDRGDLEAFLNDSISGIGQCYDLLGTFESDMESRKVLFRILHTIKGNSRLYNLMTISEVVHVAENSVVEINKRLDAKETVGTEYYAHLTQGLRKIDEVLASHSKTAESLFGLRSAASAKREDFLIQNMMANEFAIAQKQAVVFDKVQAESMSLKSQYVLSALSSSLRDGLFNTTSLVRYFGKEDLAGSMEAFAKGFNEQDIENGTADFAPVREAYFRLLFQSPRKKKYELNMDDMLDPLARMFAVSRIAKQNLASPISESDAATVFDEGFELYRSFDALAFAELRFGAQRILLNCQAGKTTEALNAVLSQMWQNVLMMFHIDSSLKSQTEGVQIDVEALTNSFESGFDDSDFESFEENQFILVDFLRSADSADVTAEEFAELMLEYSGFESTEDLAQFLAGSDESVKHLGKIFELVKDGLSTAANQKTFGEVMAELRYDFVKGYFDSCLKVASKRMDFYRIAANYLPDETLVTEVSAQQSYEVSAQWYEQVSELVEEILGNADDQVSMLAEDLKGLVESIFDYPIKTLCGKMEPMVKDLTKRLGKNINYVVAGDMVAMPREQGYQLRDALVHMLRNSLDHGIEMPSDRVARAKPDVATIEVRTRDLKGAIEVVVRDDGNGIDVEKVVKKAIAMNAISAEKAESMTPKEKQDLIFLSRLSTKDEVSSLSGRGVGMDAVKAIIVEKLKGSITLETEFAKGSKFTLTIPKLRASSSSQRSGSEVEGFLNASVKSMAESREIFGKLLSDGEARNQLFRILHTMKGSATMHNLRNIADLVHVTENIVSDMSIMIDKGESVSDLMLADLKADLDKIETSLRYELSSRTKSRVGASGSEMSYFLAQGAEQVKSCFPMVATLTHSADVGKKMFQILHTLKGNAQMNNLTVLSDSIHKVETDLETINLKVDKKEPVEQGLLDGLTTGLKSVETLISIQLKKVTATRTGRAVSEVESYLTQAASDLMSCTDWLQTVSTTPDSGQKLFQVLHTLKGNAQMHNLASLSATIHKVEGDLEQINAKVAGKNAVSESEMDGLLSGFKAVEASVAAQLRKASRGSKGGTEVENFLYQSLDDLGACAEFMVTVSKNIESGKKIFQVLHTLKGNAQLHNLAPMSAALHKVEGDLEAMNQKVEKGETIDPSVWQALDAGIKSVESLILGQLRKVSAPRAGRGGSEVENFLAQAGSDLGSCGIWLASVGNNPESGKKIFQVLHTLKGNAQMHNLTAIASAIHKVESDLENINSKVEKKESVEPTSIEALVSGIKGLESLVAAQMRKAGGNKSSRGPKSEVENFLSQAESDLADCGEWLVTVGEKTESGKKIFQILHTLKGNAQMHNLAPLAAALHKVESDLEVINTKVGKKESVEKKAVDELVAEVKSIEALVVGLLKKSSGSKASSRQEGGSEVDQYLKQASKEMTTCSDLVNAIQTDSNAGQKMFQILHTLKGNAQMHNLTALSSTIHKVESELEAINSMVDNKQAVDGTLIEALKLGLKSIESVIANQTKRAGSSRSTRAPMNEVDTFLTQVVTELVQAEQFISTLSSSPEAGQKMFQILHTLKGNAQMHNLTAIANGIHKVEGELESINALLDKKQPIDSALTQGLASGLSNLRSVIEFRLGKSGLKPIKTGNNDKDNFLNQASRDISESFELSISIGVNPEIGQKIFQILHTMKGNAQMHNLAEFSSGIHKVESDLEMINTKVDKKDSVTPAEIRNLSEGIRNLDEMISSQNRRAPSPSRSARSGNSEADNFLVQALSEIGEASDWLVTLSSSPEAGQKMFQILHTLKGNAQMHNLTAFSNALHKVEGDLESINSKIDKKEAVNLTEVANLTEGLESLLTFCKTQPVKSSKSNLRSIKKDENQLFLDSVDESISECLAICSNNVVQLEDYRQMFRTLHTLKSNAELHNLHHIVSSLHDAETNLTTLTEQLEKKNDSGLVSLDQVRQGLEKVKQALNATKKRPA